MEQALGELGLKNPDLIQILILLVLTGTLIAIWRQIVLQRRIFQAQITVGWFQMYWNTIEHPSESDIKGFKMNPGDYMHLSTFRERYENDESAISRYIDISSTYEFLAITHKMHLSKFSLPFGYEWAKLWIRDIFSASRVEFLDVHNSYAEYYPEFHSHVDEIIEPLGKSQDEVAKPAPSPDS